MDCLCMNIQGYNSLYFIKDTENHIRKGIIQQKLSIITELNMKFF